MKYFPIRSDLWARIRRTLAACCVFITTLACQSSPSAESGGTKRRAEAEREPRGDVLFVLSAASKQRLRNGKLRETGFFLGEFYDAYQAVSQAGYRVSISTAGGRAPVVDPESLKSKYWETELQLRAAQRFVATDSRFLEPLSLKAVSSRELAFQGLVVPGGQGVMVDLVGDTGLQNLILAMARSRRAIGLICHSPAILTRLPSDSPLAMKRVTSVSPLEEFFIETFVMGGKAEERKIGRSLEEAGYDYDSALPKANYAIRDDYLVTSQNPFSGAAFNEAFLPALDAARILNKPR